MVTILFTDRNADFLPPISERGGSTFGMPLLTFRNAHALLVPKNGHLSESRPSGFGIKKRIDPAGIYPKLPGHYARYS